MESLDKFLEVIHPKGHCRKMSAEHKAYLATRYPAYPLNFQVWFYRNGYEREPRCAVCGGVLKKVDAKTCSMLCREAHNAQRNTHAMSREKAKETCLARYGVGNVAQVQEVQERRIASVVKKHGGKVSDRTRQATKDRADQLNVKGRATLMERHGVSNPGQMADHREKCAATYVAKTGVDHFTKTAEWQAKQAQKKHTKWGNLARSLVTVTSVDAAVIDGYENPNDRITFRCDVCHGTETLPSETYRWRLGQNLTPCSTCSGLNKGSMAEQEVADFLAAYVIVNRHRRDLIAPLELDIYLPEHNIAIEFNGVFWHNELRVDKNYHLNKTEKCQEKGIRLIHIFEDEWLFQKDIVKSRLLDIISKNQTIDAKQCGTVILEPAVAATFLNANHLRSSGRADVCVGLERDGEIVAVMAFLRTNDEWELTRYCPATGTQVINGAAVLLERFIAENNPPSITMSTDRCWDAQQPFNGQLGFEFLRHTPLELREGHHRVWDCGRSKWIWTR